MKKEDKVTLDDFDSLYRKFGPMVMRRCQYIMKDEERPLIACKMFL